MPNAHTAAVELASLLDGSSAGELIPELARNGLQQLIQLELAAFLGADRHERTEERLGYRNGYRPRTLTTQVGDLELLIPKLRAGSFLPSIHEPPSPSRQGPPRRDHGGLHRRGVDPKG
jgi:putative transposase